MTLYCPHYKTCPFYQNWAKATGNKRKDVIVPSILGDAEKSTYYDCLTITSVQNSERTINAGKELSDSIPNLDEAACSHLDLLNMLSLNKKLRG